MLNGANSPADLGQDFGANLTARELEWMITREYARSAEDMVWRRTRLGLRLSAAQITAIDDWITARNA